jgi:fibronectin-binding autotransporter adhesin
MKKNPSLIFRTSLCGLAASALFFTTAVAQDFTFQPTAAGSYNWNDTTGTWGAASFPNAAAATITKSSGTSSNTLNQNVSGGVTIGSLTLGGSSANTWTIETPNSITFNNSGAGASITRNASNTGGRIDFAPGAGSIVLADNLTLTNTGGVSASGAIALRNDISGTGNITISNSSNSITAGHVRIEGNANTFVGSTTVSQGAVTYNNNNSFGGAGNAIFLGTVGTATLVNTTTGASTTSQNITVQSSGATIGSTGGAAGNTTYSGTLLLNGNLETSSSRTGSDSLVFSNVVSGTGGLTTGGVGNTRLTAANTYTGNTTVGAGSSLSLTSTSEIRFSLQNANVSNQVLGSGTANFAGLFRLNISGFTGATGSWNLVNVGTLTETFDVATFGLAFVGGPTFTNDGGGLYSSGDWSFSTGTGVLTVVPEPSTWILLTCGLLFVTIFRRRHSQS